MKLDVVALKGGRYSPIAQAGWMALTSSGDIADVTLFPHWDVPLVDFPKPQASSRSMTSSIFVFRCAASRAARSAIRAGDDRPCRTRCAPVDHGLVIYAHRSRRRVSRVRRTHRSDPPRCIRILLRSVAAALAAASSDIRQPYILCVANRKAHKNLDAAIDVLAQLVPVHKTLRIVFVGERFAEWKDTMSHAEELNVADRVVDLDAVSDETAHARSMRTRRSICTRRDMRDLDFQFSKRWRAARRWSHRM